MTWDGRKTDNVPWTNVTLKSGFTSAGITPQVCLRNGVIYWRGTVSGSYTASSVIEIVSAGSVPAAMRPPQRVNVTAAGSSQPASVRLYIEATGSVNVVTGSTAPSYIDLAALSPYLPD